MNKIFRIAPLITSNVNQSIRNYAFKSDLKIKWNRPEKIASHKPEKSGDGTPFPAIDKSMVLPEFQNCKELETADEKVKFLFTLAAHRERKTTDVYTQMLVDSVKQYEYDNNSIEVKVAKQTATIRRWQVVMEQYPRNKRLKVQLNELIAKRKKYLSYLRRCDYKRFEWLLEKLDLKYMGYPANYHRVTRRESLTKLTNIHCENIRDERLAAYRKQLESQQVDFLQRKLENLEFIRKEQLELALPVTVTADDIKEVALKLKNLREARADG